MPPYDVAPEPRVRPAVNEPPFSSFTTPTDLVQPPHASLITVPPALGANVPPLPMHSVASASSCVPNWLSPVGLTVRPSLMVTVPSSVSLSDEIRSLFMSRTAEPERIRCPA